MGKPALPFLGEADVGLHPGIGVADELERVVVDRLEVGREDLLARLPGLTADVEVVPVQLAERLVELQVAYRPGREGEDEAVERVDLSGVADRHRLGGVPGHRVELPAADLRVPMGERCPRHRAVPPSDAADPDRPRAADDRYIRVLEGGADRRAEVGVVDLRILVEQDEHLEIVVVGGHGEQQVVVRIQRADGLVGSLARSIPGRAQRS